MRDPAPAGWSAVPLVTGQTVEGMPLQHPGAVVLGAVATGVVGYAIAVWLARVSTWAELVEEEEYCDAPTPR